MEDVIINVNLMIGAVKTDIIELKEDKLELERARIEVNNMGTKELIENCPFCNRCKIFFRLEDSVGESEVNKKQLIDFWNKERDSE